MWQRNQTQPERLQWVGEPGNGYTIPIKTAMKEIKRAKYRSDIQDAVDQAGIVAKVRKELSHLETELGENENVLALLPATYNDERGLLVATTERLIFMFEGWVNKTFIAYDYRIVTKMRWLGGFILGRMRIYTFGAETSTKLTSVWNPVGKRFVKIVNDKTSRYTNMSREQYEVSLIASQLPKREYQIRENDLIADKIVALDKLYHDNGIERELYIIQKRDLLLSMT